MARINKLFFNKNEQKIIVDENTKELLKAVKAEYEQIIGSKSAFYLAAIECLRKGGFFEEIKILENFKNQPKKDLSEEISKPIIQMDRNLE